MVRKIVEFETDPNNEKQVQERHRLFANFIIHSRPFIGLILAIVPITIESSKFSLNISFIKSLFLGLKWFVSTGGGIINS